MPWHRSPQQATLEVLASTLHRFRIASDAHSLPGRKFVLSEALYQIAEDFGEQKALEFESNAEKLINGDYVTARDYSPIKKKKRFLFF